MVVEALCGLHLLTHEGIPVFAFGHEFGALMAFEICRRVQADFPVKGVFVSGMTCPQVGGALKNKHVVLSNPPEDSAGRRTDKNKAEAHQTSTYVPHVNLAMLVVHKGCCSAQRC